MLSKMARPETNYEGQRYFKIVIRNDLQSCYKKITNWQKVLSNGRIIHLKIDEDYKEANAYIYTTIDVAKYLNLNNTREPSINLDHYDGDIEVTSNPTKKNATVDNINLDINNLVQTGQFTQKEAEEIYRNVVKWDIYVREKSSDSESNSDSDCDTKKLQKHNWQFCGEENIIIGTFDIYKT